MDQSATLRIEGEIVSRTTAYFEYKIHNYFSMPEQVDKVFRSPDFFFSNGTWYLKIYPYGQTKHNSEGWIGVYLVKKNSFTSEHFVIYTLGIKKVNGTDYDSFTFEDNFGKNGTGIGTPKFMTKYALVENRDLIAPDGTMTFFCNLLEKDFPKQTVENIEDEVAKVPLEGKYKLIWRQLYKMFSLVLLRNKTVSFPLKIIVANLRNIFSKM